MTWHPTEADTGAFFAQYPEEIHDMATERVVSIFALNCLQARHWVRVDYNIVLYRIHVPVIVQCQCECCRLSSKDGTVILESFGQLAASRLTNLEIAVDDHYCPHSLVNLWSVSVDFIMWSLSIVILSEFGLNLFSCDHTFAHPFNEVVSLRIVFMFLAERLVSSGGRPFLRQSLQRLWLPIFWDQWFVPGVGSFLLFHLA